MVATTWMKEVFRCACCGTMSGFGLSLNFDTIHCIDCLVEASNALADLVAADPEGMAQYRPYARRLLDSEDALKKAEEKHKKATERVKEVTDTVKDLNVKLLRAGVETTQLRKQLSETQSTVTYLSQKIMRIHENYASMIAKQPPGPVVTSMEDEKERLRMSIYEQAFTKQIPPDFFKKDSPEAQGLQL